MPEDIMMKEYQKENKEPVFISEYKKSSKEKIQLHGACLCL